MYGLVDHLLQISGSKGLHMGECDMRHDVCLLMADSCQIATIQGIDFVLEFSIFWRKVKKFQVKI